MDTQNDKKTEKPSGGLYARLTMSPASADRLVLASCALLIGVMLFGIRNGGFTVRFDTDGGSGIEAQKVLRSESVLLTETPHKEGYSFTGWYRDPDRTQLWSINDDTVTESMTLYAGWEPIEE